MQTAFPQGRSHHRAVPKTPLLAALLGAALLACGGGNELTNGVTDTQVTVPTLVGVASIAADSTIDGPTSGQFISGGDYTTATASYGYTLPFVNKQPVQGFSAFAAGPVAGCYYAMQDNGFGGKAASPDALLQVVAIKPDWTTGKVTPANFATCATQASFDANSVVRLRDPDQKLGYALVADAANYPGTSTSPTGQRIAVDPLIRNGRLLTGADIDPESLVIDADGNFWFGEEFGPFLIKTDRTGKVLSREIALPNTLKLGSNPLVQTSNNPYIASGSANLPGSGGLESMAINPARTRIYTMFEREISTDSNLQRRILNVFDIASGAFLNTAYSYQVGSGSYVNGAGATIKEIYTVNDLTAINDHEFLVMEKDRGAGDARTGNYPAAGADRVAAKVKKIYKIDLNQVDANGYLIKQELVDLMNLADPRGLGGSATINQVFTFPMESVEAIRVVDRHTIMVANDNNYPGGAGARVPKKPDNNEFILIRLPVALDLR